MAGTRLVLDFDVAPGNRPRPKSAGNMASCEGAGLDYLFKLRLTKGAHRLAERLMGRDGWEDAGQGWSGIEAELRLQGWSRTRRVVVLRRRLPGTVALTRVDDGQSDLFWAEPTRSLAPGYGSSRFWRHRWILRFARSPSSIGIGLTRRTPSTS